MSGMLDNTPQMADAFGVPEFFYTDVGRIETAGGSCLRIYCCTKRDGVLIPVFTVVMPALSLAIAAKSVSEAAANMMSEAMKSVGVH